VVVPSGLSVELGISGGRRDLGIVWMTADLVTVCGESDTVCA
jgi:hypothetical protein